jgi:hypothetical protein
VFAVARRRTSADVENPAWQIDSGFAKVLGRGRYERQNSRSVPRVERLRHLGLPFLEVGRRWGLARLPSRPHLLSRNVVLAETVPLTPGSQPSQGHRIQCAWNGRALALASFCSSARPARACGIEPFAAAVRPSSREVDRSRCQDDRANNHEDNNCQ